MDRKHTEISFEDFEKYVLNKPNEYFNKLYNTNSFSAKGEYTKFDGSTYNDYLHFPKIKRDTTNRRNHDPH